VKLQRGTEEKLFSGDASTRALSVAPVRDAFVEETYDKIAVTYDWTMGPALHAGRLQARERLPLAKNDRVLEVGVGTGINAALYPSDVSVTGIDVSQEMLDKAERRLAGRNVRNVRLMQMDAAKLDFPDNSFDLVYAPFVISVVHDPVAVAREMKRVCRPAGHLVILNHFLSANRFLARLERLISPITIHAGFKSDVDLPAFLAQAELEPVSVEKVALYWTFILCGGREAVDS